MKLRSTWRKGKTLHLIYNYNFTHLGEKLLTFSPLSYPEANGP